MRMWGVCGLMILSLLLVSCGQAAPGALAVGDTAPAFTLPAATGEQVSLADFTGKQPVLLYFHMAAG